MASKGRRRSHGEGSVYRRASDGRWVGTINLGYVNGKRVRKTVYGTSEKDVLATLRDLRKAVESGRDLTTKSPTFGAWLDTWLAEKEASGTRPSTLRSYKWLIESHVRPTLGSVPLDKVTKAQVGALIADKRRSSLSSASVNHVITLLRNTLSDAERQDLVDRNVALAVRKAPARSREHRVLGVEEARLLLKHLRGRRLEALFVTTLMLGLRRSEVLALQWSDIDLKGASVQIRHSLQRVGGSLRFEEATKTASSRSTVAIPNGLVRVLIKHRARQAKERLALGGAWPGTDFVFTSTTGTPLEPRNVSRTWDTIRTEVGLTEVTLHDLRHSCASILVALGVHPRVVMETLRHSQIGVTMNTYVHVAPALQRAAAGMLDEALFG